MIKLDMILNNSSSPIVSTLRQTQKYSGDEMQNKFHNYCDTMHEDELKELPDIKDVNRAVDKMATVESELETVT